MEEEKKEKKTMREFLTRIFSKSNSKVLLLFD